MMRKGRSAEDPTGTVPDQDLYGGYAYDGNGNTRPTNLLYTRYFQGRAVHQNLSFDI